MTTFEDIEAQLPYVDDPDVLRKAESNGALQIALEWSRPVNWWGTGLKPGQLIPIAEEGIPVAWLPKRAILEGLVNAGRRERIALLMSHAEEIAQECRSLIDECCVISGTSFNDRKPLLLRALDALEATHHEASMALAINVAEGLALWASSLNVFALPSVRGGSFEARDKKVSELLRYRKYGLALDELNSGILNRELFVARRALLAPIPRFFDGFFPGKGNPVPEMLSRHAAAHQPTVGHYSKGNALLAVMLATSLLREYESHLDNPEPDYDHEA